MLDLSSTVPRDECATLTSDLDSLKSTITEIEVVKNCDFIEEEANSITGKRRGKFFFLCVCFWSIWQLKNRSFIFFYVEFIGRLAYFVSNN